MADIQIVGADLDGSWIRIQRTIDGNGHGERMPKECLAIRAAEYNLEVDDPRALDILLLERWYTPDNPDETHPLFRMANIDDALNEVLRRIEIVRVAHNAPENLEMRILSSAADSGKATEGLVQAKELLLEHAPGDIAWAVQHQRDLVRREVRTKPLSMADKIKQHSLSMLQGEAIEIERRRKGDG